MEMVRWAGALSGHLLCTEPKKKGERSAQPSGVARQKPKSIWSKVTDILAVANVKSGSRI
jgi:hypothetical protein